MNITPQINFAPLATVVNPQTDSLRRENLQREIITQPKAVNHSVAEKGVASDKDKAKTPAQNNEHIDFANIRKRAEAENSTISDQSDSGANSEQNNPEQEQREQATDRGQEGNPLKEFAEQQEIKELSQRDREVRSHEQAHAAVGGAHTGAPSYTFTVGPDGKKYATDGEVSVDLSSVPGDPRATIAKLEKVHAAALAPANPSIQDTRIAARASRLILQAKSELLAEQLNKPELAKEQQQTSEPRSSFTEFQITDDNYSSNDTDKGSTQQFDNLINDTLKAQEAVAPSRSEEVTARAGRIKEFYQEISSAYTKAPVSNFELTA